ncbi:MAG: molybdopterin-dependent oxidoreductase [Pseudomonadota bacterium]
MPDQDKKPGIKEDVWVPTACGMCYGDCAVMAHRVDGTVIKLEGDPRTSQGYGRICAKGVAGLQNLYDPNRVNAPLIRTNPEKGLGVDPKWKEISWDEALDIFVEKLRALRQDDPRKLLFQSTTIHGTHTVYGLIPFVMAYGSPNFWVSGGGVHCGAGAHLLAGMNHASWDMVPDWDYCNYAITFGASHGHAAGHSALLSSQLAADARARGMKLVAFDPMANFVGGKATEWVPIIPGADSIVVLTMANVIVNELEIIDEPFLKTRTNGPYLVGPDRLFVRDRESGKPLVWDPAEEKA